MRSPRWVAIARFYRVRNLYGCAGPLFLERQPPAVRHVPDRLARLAERFAGERQVVMAIGERRVGAQRALVGSDRVALAIHVLEHYAQVVEQHRILAAGFEALEI